MNHYGGIYRAQVINKDDPEQRGRVQIRVPAIHGLATAIWAEPCFHLPDEISADLVGGVWVMFEAGDPSKPVWMGVWQ